MVSGLITECKGVALNDTSQLTLLLLNSFVLSLALWSHTTGSSVRYVSVCAAWSS